MHNFAIIVEEISKTPDGTTGSFLMPRGSTRTQALEIVSAAGLCD